MIEYTVLTTDNRPDFLILVADAIREGWRPQGGVSVSWADVRRDNYTERDYVYAQAMVRGREE